MREEAFTLQLLAMAERWARAANATLLTARPSPQRCSV